MITVCVHTCRTISPFPMNVPSFFIRLFQDMYSRPKEKRWNHVALSTKNPHFGEYFDSSFWGVRKKPLKKFFKSYKIITTYEYDVAIDYDQFIAWFNKHEGKMYGFDQIPGLLLRVFRIIKKNPFGAGAKRIICNELAILFLNRFVEQVAEKDMIDSFDLLDTEKILEDHFKKGICRKIEMAA